MDPLILEVCAQTHWVQVRLGPFFKKKTNNLDLTFVVPIYTKSTHCLKCYIYYFITVMYTRLINMHFIWMKCVEVDHAEHQGEVWVWRVLKVPNVSGKAAFWKTFDLITKKQRSNLSRQAVNLYSIICCWIICSALCCSVLDSRY